jgi:hypothetical protein
MSKAPWYHKVYLARMFSVVPVQSHDRLLLPNVDSAERKDWHLVGPAQADLEGSGHLRHHWNRILPVLFQK